MKLAKVLIQELWQAQDPKTIAKSDCNIFFPNKLTNPLSMKLLKL